jgi:hypothetical protein
MIQKLTEIDSLPAIAWIVLLYTVAALVLFFLSEYLGENREPEITEDTDDDWNL